MEALLLLLLVPFVFGGLFSDDEDEDHTINGTEQDDTLAGDFHDETINAMSGADDVRGHAGDDTIFGGAGADDLAGDNGDDRLHGEDGRDELFGGAGTDTLVGDVAADSLSGEDGDDLLFGGKGQDSALGGEGNDTIWLGGGDDFGGTEPEDEDNLFGDPNDLGDDRIDGGDGDDEVWDLAGSNSLTGGLGHDFLVAVDDTNTDDPDTLSGGWGYDTLVGDDGDELSGGEMDDEFGVYLDEATDEAVTITDFDADRETLELYVVVDNFPDFEGGLSSETDPETGEVSLFLDQQLVAVLQLTDPTAAFSLGRVNINYF